MAVSSPGPYAMCQRCRGQKFDAVLDGHGTPIAHQCVLCLELYQPPKLCPVCKQPNARPRAEVCSAACSKRKGHTA